MAELKTGGEVDSFCGKCKMLLAHTVLAVAGGKIARVRCNTCKSEHAYKAGAPVTRTSRAGGKKAATPRAAEKPAVDSFEVLSKGKDLGAARRYNVKEKYEVGEVVDHPTFGLGVVAAVRALEKMDVAFQLGVKTLVQNKGAGPKLLRPLRPVVREIEADGDDGASGTEAVPEA
jgi:hypothetical protein